MSLPTVDIVIAGRNEARHLGECLEALRAQNYPAEKLKIFVVDNNSTDETADIARAKGVVLLRQTKVGASAARNLGIENGQGELIGFLDAHCIPNRDWVRALAEVFADARVGGAQGFIESRADDARVQKHLETTNFLGNAQVLDDTILGKKNLYPWLLGGNSMFRREAVLEIGAFNEGLLACEDVEISWRVFLAGYEFRYVDAAKVVHFDGNSWRQFLRKGASYARGAADLARIYQSHGASNKFAPAPLWTQNWARSLSAWHYRVGYLAKNARLRFGFDEISWRSPPQVLPRFRPWFLWNSDQEIQISTDAFFWFRDAETFFNAENNSSKAAALVAVQIPTKQRAVLEGVSAFIWWRLVEEKSRDEMADEMAQFYEIARTTALYDIDDFVAELEYSKFVSKREKA